METGVGMACIAVLVNTSCTLSSTPSAGSPSWSRYMSRAGHTQIWVSSEAEIPDRCSRSEMSMRSEKGPEATAEELGAAGSTGVVSLK